MDTTKTGLLKKRYYIKGKDRSFYFTYREAQCLSYLAKGNSSKQIGKILELSPRTVQSYLDKIKNKFNCNTRSELIQKAIEYNFLTIESPI